MKCQVCCCEEHCEYKLHFPAKVKLEEVPLALDTEMMSVAVLHSMEEGEAPCDDSVDLVGLLNSVNVDISGVFGQ